jgi:hypothetical protein
MVENQKLWSAAILAGIGQVDKDHPWADPKIMALLLEIR